jgi:hypothetical protein
MSHFSTVRTELRDRDALMAALKDLGQTPTESQQLVRGYKGETLIAELCCMQPDGGDIGFRWNPKEDRYELVTDLQLWSLPVPLERFMAELTQRYALHSIIKSANSEGYELAEQRLSADGTIELVVTRWQG